MIIGTSEKPPIKADSWAWGLCWLMFASTALNYMDRQTITLVGKEIQAEYTLTQEGFGWVLAAFQLSYAASQIPAGFLADRFDVRWAYALAVIWWSAAGIAGAFSPTLGILMVMRGLLGFGESFNWPCALKVTSRVLPPSDRGLGNGIFNSGAAVGAVLTPLSVPWITANYGWRMALIVVGSLGFVWVIAWGLFLRDPRSIRLAYEDIPQPDSLEELPPTKPGRGLIPNARFMFMLTLIAPLLAIVFFPQVGKPAIWWAIAGVMIGLLAVARILPLVELEGSSWALSLGQVVRLRRFWVMAVVSVSINVCWHFLVNWLPTYLRTDRGMTLLAGGMFSAIPFLAADAGNLAGGAIAKGLAQRGFAPDRARLIVLCGCVLLIGCGTFVGIAENNTLVIVLLATMALGTAGFMANYFAFCQEVSSRNTGLIVGFLGALGNLFAAGFLPVVGWVKDTTGSFGGVFLAVGLLPVIGLFTLALGWGWTDSAEEVA